MLLLCLIPEKLDMNMISFRLKLGDLNAECDSCLLTTGKNSKNIMLNSALYPWEMVYGLSRLGKA